MQRILVAVMRYRDLGRHLGLKEHPDGKSGRVRSPQSGVERLLR